MADDEKIIPVTLQPKIVYGLRGECVGNIHFTLKQDVIYPIEGVLALHDFVTNKQRFLRFPDRIAPHIIAMSPNRKMLAILEVLEIKNEDKKQSVIIYDLATLKRRRTLLLPPPLNPEFTVYDVSIFAFTNDSRSLYLITGPPDEMLFLFYFDKADTVVSSRVGTQRTIAKLLSPNPQDPNLICIAGESVMKLIVKTDKGFTINKALKLDREFIITSIAWISIDIVIAGTSKGKLWFLEMGEMKFVLDARDAEAIDLLKEQEEGADLGLDHKSIYAENKVVCVSVFPRGVAYAIFNQVWVFEKDSKYKYLRKTVLIINIDIYPEDTYQIMNMAINQQQDTVIVTTKHNQIYVGILIVPETLKTKYLQFRTLGEYIHIDEIIDISLCSWRPIILTASKDQTIRVWNYETEKVELVKKYQIEITRVELNPTGLFAALGFEDQLRLTEIFVDDFKIIKTYNFPRCKDIKYSNFGHLMAAAHETVIAITSVYKLEVLKMLKGHNGIVLSVAWTKDDKYLFSGGIEGAVYQWDVETGLRIQEVVQKGIEYRSLAAVDGDPPSAYGVTNIGTFRELAHSEIVREIKVPSGAPLRSVAVARSDLVMFVSTEQGQLYNIQIPFLDAGGGTCTNYRFFASCINKIQISHDGTLLVTASKRGTLGVWVLKNIEGRIASMDPDLLSCREILIPRATLQDKIQSIANLELRLKQQLAEFQYQINQNEIFDEQQMAAVHKGYCAIIEELKLKNQDMGEKHIEELNLINNQIKELKQDFENQMDQLATQYSERMLAEYNKFAHLRDNMIEMRESYEEKLRKSAGCLQDTIEALETDFKKQLHQRQELIRQLMQEMEDKKVEFIEYCRQVEADNDRNMVESQFQFQKKLKEEQDLTLKWRGEAGINKMKFTTMAAESEILREEVYVLKQEHAKSKAEIEKAQRASEDLRKEIEEREFVIAEKEKRNYELNNKNQELEKYKQVLTHKINELKAQIEPRERQIKEKRNQIVEMEHELEGLHSSNIKFELQLNEVKDKFIGITSELKVEKQRAKFARNYTTKICSDIYNVAGKIDNPHLLKEGVKELFKKYSDDRDLRKAIELDMQAKSEFQRQREHLETITTTCQQRLEKSGEPTKIKKLLNENILLIEELNLLRGKLSDTKKQLLHIESLIGVGYKNLSQVGIKLKIEKAVAETEKMENRHQQEVLICNNKITELTKENDALTEKIEATQKALEALKLAAAEEFAQ